MEQAIETLNFVRCGSFSCWIVGIPRRCLHWGQSSQEYSQIRSGLFQYIRWTFNSSKKGLLLLELRYLKLQQTMTKVMSPFDIQIIMTVLHDASL